MVEINIENIIASATMSNGLDLEKIIDTLPNCEYNPNQFPGVIFKPGDPPIFILLFNSGKVMVTAAKSIEDVEKGMELVENELNKAGLIIPEGAVEEPKSKEEGGEVPEAIEGESKEPAEEPTAEEAATEGEEIPEEPTEEPAEESAEGEEVPEEPTEEPAEGEEVPEEPAVVEEEPAEGEEVSEETAEEPADKGEEPTEDVAEEESEEGKEKPKKKSKK
jgi:hypothetical protein